MRGHTRKILPWTGWSKEAPNAKQRTKMYNKCGKKCFLGKITTNKQHPNFPICIKNTCKVSKKGVYAAYIRSRQWGSIKSNYLRKHPPTYARKTYKNIANRAQKML